MRVIKFKNPDVYIKMQDGTIIDHSNITPDKYDRLISLSPSYEQFFTTINENELDTKKKSTIRPRVGSSEENGI